jgi:hypothetical protein
MATQFRALSFDARGRTALALALVETGASRDELLTYAAEAANELASIALPCSSPHAHLLRAGIQSIRGDVEGAAELLCRAEAELTSEEGSPLTAMVVRRIRGTLMKRPRWVDEADGFLRVSGVKAPAYWAQLYAPGFSTNSQ